MADQIEIEMQIDELILTQNFKEALSKIDIELLNFPDSYSIIFAKGQALMGLARFKEALHCFQLCSEKSVYLAYPHFYLALCYSLMSDKVKMFESLQKAISIDKKTASLALKNQAFAKYYLDPEFINIIGLPSAAPLDPILKSIYNLRSTDLSHAYTLALNSLGQISDQASVLDALLDILNLIIEDIEEHGEEVYSHLELSYSKALQHRDSYLSQRDKLKQSKSAYFILLLREGIVTE